MNIAILNFHRLGGSGIVAYEIGKAMAEKKNYHVHFVGLQHPFRYQENFNEKIHYHKISIKEYPVFDFQPYTLALASQLAELVERMNIHVIHSHYAIPHAIAAILAKQISKKKVKCITTLHGTDITIVGSHSSMIHITKYAIENSDKITVVSNYLKEKTEKFFQINPNKIQTIYNFVNPNYYKMKENKKLENPIIFFHSSNLRVVKNPLETIKIFDQIQKKTSKKCFLWVVGEGPLEHRMLTLCKKLNIEDKVKFLGIQVNPAHFLKKASFFLSTSQDESFGLAALEAMACGVPVISTRVGGVSEVVIEGKDGYLFEPKDISKATEIALSLINNPKKWEVLSKNAYDSARKRFAMNEIIEQYNSLYQ